MNMEETSQILFERGFAENAISTNDCNKFPLFKTHNYRYSREQIPYLIPITCHVLLNPKEEYIFDYLVYIIKGIDLDLTDTNAWTSKIKNFAFIRSPLDPSVFAIFTWVPKLSQSPNIKILEVLEGYETEVKKIVESFIWIKNPRRNEKKTIEEVRKLSEEGVKSLQIKNYNKNITDRKESIYFAITNLGESTEDNWKTFPVYIEVSEALLIVRVFFSYNSQYHKFEDAIIEQYLYEFLAKANVTIPFGYFSIISNRGFVQFYVSYPYYLVKGKTWKKTIVDYVRLGVVIYKSYGWALAQIVEKTKRNQKPNIDVLIEECKKRFESQKQKGSSGLKPNVSIMNEETKDPTEDEDEDEESKEDIELRERLKQSDLQFYFEFEDTGDNNTIERAIFENEFNAGDIRRVLNFIFELYEQGIYFKYFPESHLLYYKDGDDEIGSPNAKFRVKAKFLYSVIVSNTRWTFDQYKKLMIALFNKYLFEIRKLRNAFANKDDYIPEEHFQFPDINSDKRQFASGGFGFIYTNCLYGSRVAVKVPKESKESKEKAKRRIVREYLLMKQLPHKGILRAYGLVLISTKKGQGNKQQDLENSKIGLVMDLCSGKNLNEYSKNCRKSNKFNETEMLLKLYDIEKAIEFIHMKGITHFDIKPHNILMNKKSILVSDFGLSRHTMVDQRIKTGYTLMYTSPEQIKGDSEYTDYSCDVWSFGMTMYAVMIGKSPYYYLEEGGKKLRKKRYKTEIASKMRFPHITNDFERDNFKQVEIMRMAWSYYNLIPFSQFYRMKDLRREFEYLLALSA